MFAEADFCDDEDDWEAPQQHPKRTRQKKRLDKVAAVETDSDDGEAKLNKKKHRRDAARQATTQQAKDFVVTLHTPADTKNFRAVANPQSSDFSGMEGDEWGNAHCHCIRCDTIRSSSLLLSLSSSSSSATPGRLPLIVMLDMDNFGFVQFKTPWKQLFEKASSKKNKRKNKVDNSTAKNALEDGDEQGFFANHCNVLFWCFYGACFKRKFGVANLSQLTTAPSYFQARDAKKENELSKGKRKEEEEGEDGLLGAPDSLWNVLLRQRRVYFTPCGGYKQAVDTTMLQVLATLLQSTTSEEGSNNRRCRFVSGDKHLCTTASQLITDSNGNSANGVLQLEPACWKQPTVFVSKVAQLAQ